MKRATKPKAVTPAVPLPRCATCRQLRFAIDRAGLVRCTVCFAPQHPIMSSGTLAEFLPFMVLRSVEYRAAMEADPPPGYTAPEPPKKTRRRKG